MVDGRGKPPAKPTRRRAAVAAVTVTTPTTGLAPSKPAVVLPTPVPSTPDIAADTPHKKPAPSNLDATSDDEKDAAAAARLRDHHRAGQPVTGALLARELGVSERTGRRRLNYFKATFPDLFEVESAQ
jgi:hypothetical protein